jgi:CheY-like chemotaxis protein
MSTRGKRSEPVSDVAPRSSTVDRVLVVEDDCDARELLVLLLESQGFAASSAATVSEALEAIERDAFDVVAIDLWLEDRLDGLDLARKLRGHPLTRRMGLVAMSGHVEPEWPIVQPFDAYLRKPIDVDLFTDLIARLADLRRAPRTGLTGTGTGSG